MFACTKLTPFSWHFFWLEYPWEFSSFHSEIKFLEITPPKKTTTKKHKQSKTLRLLLSVGQRSNSNEEYQLLAHSLRSMCELNFKLYVKQMQKEKLVEIAYCWYPTNRKILPIHKNWITLQYGQLLASNWQFLIIRKLLRS